MSIFLFLKQIVDILYPYHWLDYMMVAMAIIALVYQMMLVRPNIKGRVTLSDYCIGMFVLLFSIAFIRTEFADYSNFVKVMSALFMYFLGRIYYERIQECESALSISSYIVVYANFLYRVLQHGMSLLSVENARGDLYYYDTDMSVAMLIALSFIAMYARNTIRKFFTMIVIIPYMVIYSDADVQKILLMALFGIMVLYVLEMAGVKRKVSDFMLGAAIIGLLVVVMILISPVFTGSEHNFLVELLYGDNISAQNIYSRYEGWRDVWRSISESDTLTKFFGLGLMTDVPIYSMYLKILYVMGLSGLILLFAFIFSVVYYVIQVEDRKTYYVTVLLAVILLGTGLLTNSIEATQMSWFPMMFAGMVVSSVQAERLKIGFEEYELEGNERADG